MIKLLWLLLKGKFIVAKMLNCYGFCFDQWDSGVAGRATFRSPLKYISSLVHFIMKFTILYGLRWVMGEG